jgi:hypothetical protein
MGISSKLYAADTEVFPAFYGVDTNGRGNHWFEALSKYVSSQWPETDLPGLPNPSKKVPTGIFACPAYSRLSTHYVNPHFAATIQPFGSYGYNRSGTIGPYAKPGMGLGGTATRADSMVNSADDIAYTREDSVMAPSDFLAFGDSAVAWLVGIGSAPNPSVGLDCFEAGYGIPFIRKQVGLSYFGLTNVVESDRAMMRRHAGKFQAVPGRFTCRDA